MVDKITNRIPSPRPSGQGEYIVISGIPPSVPYYNEDAGLPYFDHAAVIANGNWKCGSALKSMGTKLCFRSCLKILALATHIKRVKVVNCPQNVKNVNYILLRIPENKGGLGNPSASIDVNTFRTTNFRC